MNYKTKVISLNGVPTEVVELPNQANSQMLGSQMLSQNIKANPIYSPTVEFIPQQVYYQNQQPIPVSSGTASDYSYYDNQNQANINYSPNGQLNYQGPNNYNNQNYQAMQNQHYFSNPQQQFSYNQEYSEPQSNFDSNQNKIQELRKALAESKKNNSNKTKADSLDDFDFGPSQLHEYVDSLSPIAQSKYKTLKYLLNTGNISMDEYLVKLRKIFMEDVDA